MSKKLLSILALLCLTVTSAWADDSGTCGTSLTWSYVESTHTLTISGTGAMTDFGYMETPWYGYRTDITNIVIEDGVTTIGEYAFIECENLTTVTIPNNVTSIGYMAFLGCYSLKTVTIGSGVTSIGDRAFESCNSLTEITVSGENLYYKSVDNVLFTKDGTLLKYPEGITATSYTIPNDVETIGDRAFIFSNLTEVIIPDGVETIGDGAFTNCLVTELTIPNSVTTIGEYAFSACEDLTTLNIGSGVTSIGNGPCQGCYSLTDITVSGGTYFKSVNNVLFTYDGKTLVQYPAGSTATSYTIPDGVETISANAFDSSDNLTEVIIPDGVETIGNGAFQFCLGLTTMNIPSSVTTIDDAFYSCKNLATVTLNSNPYIGLYAFDIDGYGTTPAVTMNLTAKSAGGAQWMTFYSSYGNFQADANTQVFKAELSGTTITLHEVTDKIVDAGTAVVLKSTGDPVMTLTTSPSSDSQANSLKGVDNPEGEGNDGNFYVLNYKAATGVGFYKLADGKKLGYGKAYLWYSGSLAPGYFGFGETTGINAVNGSEFMINGSDIYNLNGQRVAQPTKKGLYIVNGRKVVIK